MNHKFLLLVLLNVLFVIPAVILFYLVEPDSANVAPEDKNLVNIFNFLVFPAIVTVFLDIVFLLKYARTQDKVIAAQPKKPETGWRKYAHSGLFWFNILALLPCIIILSLSVFFGGAGLNIGHAFIFIFLLPIALVTLALDIYHLLKR